MKCKIITKDLLKELKEVFAEKAAKGCSDESQLMQIGNDIVLVRMYYTSKAKKATIKTCTFAYDFIEPLAKTMKLDCHERFLSWIKNADDIETAILTLNEDNCRATLEYKTPCGEGCVEFTMDNINKEIPIGKAKEDIDLSSVEKFTCNARPFVYFYDGVMMATDGYIMKVADTDVEGSFAINTNTKEVEKTSIPDYKIPLHSRDMSEYEFTIDKNRATKILKFWQSEYKKHTNSKYYKEHCSLFFEPTEKGELYMCYDLKDGQDRRLVGSSIKNTNVSGASRIYYKADTLLKVMQDTKEKSITIYAFSKVGSVTYTDNSLYVFMPVTKEKYMEVSIAR